MDIHQELTVSQIVTNNSSSIPIFKKHDIDFCCHGDIILKEVCKNQSIDLKTLISELQENEQKIEHNTTDFNSWPLDLLIDYIEKKHHRYTEAAIIEIKPLLNKICSVHGNNHPELNTINQLFIESAGELSKHMKKEELIVFPLIKRLYKPKSNDQNVSSQSPHIENPIHMMKHEHEIEGQRFQKISDLSHQYTPPTDACHSYKLCLAMLKEFENDLHIHIHLENNILFPKALQLQNSK